ncbi:MAG: thiamine pyrophosphate-dependent enzyme [Polyangiaceae bacterium]
MSESPVKLPLVSEEAFFGHKACGGCGGTIALRLALKALGPRVFLGIPAGCMSAVSFLYPQMALHVNAMITPFAATAAVISGMAAAVRALGLDDVHVVGFAGDGGTADIGLQALSGAIERRDRIMYICYDNEAYMNTGVQRSGLTPWGASTTTSHVGSRSRGAKTNKKDLFDIMVAHGIEYAATASVGYARDYLRKIQLAARVDGPSYIQVLAPCPTGWGTDSAKTIELARKAVDTGLWPLRQYASGEYSVQHARRVPVDVREYTTMQGRFGHLDADDLGKIERDRDAMWNRIRSRIHSNTVERQRGAEADQGASRVRKDSCVESRTEENCND